MKLIRIGSSSSNDIQLTSSYVSSTHAEITLLDGGEIILEDLGSTNGTFVGDKKIKANQEISIRRGDKVRFADTELVWSRVPSLTNNTSYARIVNIGTNYRNDVQINSGAVSRFHATIKIDKKGKTFIVDNGSKNGTKVNGIKIAKDVPTPIKRGDNIILGNEDVTETIQQYIPLKKNVLLISLISLAVAASIAAIAFILPKIFMTEPDETAIAHVFAGYHYEIRFKDTPVEFSTLKLRYPSEGECHFEGTAFFIDSKGHLATNKHITSPWNSSSNEDTPLIRQAAGAWVLSLFGSDYIDTRSELTDLISSPQGKELYEYVTERFPVEQQILQLNVLINSIRNAEIEIKGVLNDIRIGYSGRMYDRYAEYEPCTVIAEDENTDLAIIRLNNMKTPENKDFFDINHAYVEKLEPLKKELCTTGFPSGIAKAFSTTRTLQPTTYETKCSKRPERYIFECQSLSAGGASGSPVYLKGTDKLVGVLSQRWRTNEGGIICVQARYLKELYDKECK